MGGFDDDLRNGLGGFEERLGGFEAWSPAIFRRVRLSVTVNVRGKKKIKILKNNFIGEPLATARRKGLLATYSEAHGVLWLKI